MTPDVLPDCNETMVAAGTAHQALRIPMQWLNNKVER